VSACWRRRRFIYAHHSIRFRREATIPENELRALIAEHGFSIANLNYRLRTDGQFFEYRMTIRTRKGQNASRLARTLNGMPSVVEFRIAPTGD